MHRSLFLYFLTFAVWLTPAICLVSYDLNPDIFRSTPELINSRGFLHESHNVTTNDGYILGVFRIVNPYLRHKLPNGRSRPRPVLLWHGVAVTSDSWLYSTVGSIKPNGVYTENNVVSNDCFSNVTATLSYTLASCGYDVWLANSRGNVYSNKHVQYDSQADVRYWQYTLTELAIYDIPAVINYILQQTGEKSLAYVGHSLGTSSMFALQSLMPEIQNLVQPFIALAPVAYIGNIWSSFRLGVPLEPLLKIFPGPLGLPPWVMQLIGAFICGNELLTGICENILFTMNGYDPKNLNRTIVPVDYGHIAATTSTWLYAHLAQLVISNEYRMFDLGEKQNMIRYGTATPPPYPLENITSKHIALFRGQNDALADVKDVNHLVNRLTVPLLSDYTIPYKKWNHQDFQLGTTQGFYVNKPLLSILRQFD